MTSTQTAQAPTDKQLAFAAKLIGERFPAADVEAVTDAAFKTETRRAMSRLIDDLLAMPKAAPAVAPPAQRVEGALDLADLPAGRYAVPGGDTRLKVRIDKPSRGSWAGWTFVKDAAEYGTGQRYGRQEPGGTYSGKITAELAAIMADPQGATAAYGHLTGTCGVCGRHLEDEDSVERGIGPVCLAKRGW